MSHAEQILALDLARPRCATCGGVVVYGEPAHAMTITMNGETRIEHRCRECAEELARDLWPDDWGPCPYLPMMKATGKLS